MRLILLVRLLLNCCGPVLLVARSLSSSIRNWHITAALNLHRRQRVLGIADILHILSYKVLIDPLGESPSLVSSHYSHRVYYRHCILCVIKVVPCVRLTSCSTFCPTGFKSTLRTLRNNRTLLLLFLLSPRRDKSNRPSSVSACLFHVVMNPRNLLCNSEGELYFLS